MMAAAVKAQQVDLSTIGKDLKKKLFDKKPWKISGGINANTVFYTGNAGSGRDPLTYMLSGNMNVSLYGVSVPLSFTYTNAGFSYNYKLPNKPNRLSLHPRYKWITAHVGDVSMTFSPYTLSGHQFTGGGLDLSPRGSWKVSVMGGRLQRAVELDTANRNVQPTYKRMGYGAKVGYDKAKVKFGVSVFRAQDDVNSLAVKPDSLQVYPMANTAVSYEGQFPVMKNLVLKGEYGLSALTGDVRAPRLSDTVSRSFFDKAAGARISTRYFKAYKTQLNYVIGSSSVGVGYEWVDPGYRTLGAYYFSNDLENITVNFAQSLFKGKVNLSGNVGLQRDDLDHEKTGGSRRQVGAVTANYNASERLTMTVTYSNFQTFTNVKPQFQYINQLTPYDNLDTLNFRQLSQNANCNINYVVSNSKDRPKNLNLNFSLQDAFDEQGGVISKGNASAFYNFAGSYAITDVPKSMTISHAFNATYNTIGKNDMLTLGPTVSVNRPYFHKKVNCSGSLSYNLTKANYRIQNQVCSFRLTGTYTFRKKHNFNLSGVGMWRAQARAGMQYDMTATVGYSYSFSK